MKKILTLLLFTALIGVAAWLFLGPTENPTLPRKVNEVADTTQDAAAGAKATVADKAGEWKLTPGNIKEELAKTGRVVRSKARVMGEHIDDARIVAVIKSKYVMDKNLSVLAIGVGCRDGVVLLTGSVTSEENISRAITLALQTGGVHNVESQLVVKN